MSKRFTKIAALGLSAAMVLGGTLTAFAAEAGVGTGTGTYEGGEIKYPTVSITLPTIQEGTYDYIADPNGLIAKTKDTTSHYTDATFTGNTGVFFKTGEKTYADKSNALEVTNQNAQDVDITVKMEVTTPGDSIIQYANSATFEAEDKTNKLYLAITDGAQESPQVAALSAAGTATVTTKVEGVPSNYKPVYKEGGYTYEKIDNPTDWKKCSFQLTGAINTNATWGDNVAFPAIKVTWSFKEHTDAYVASTTISATSNSITLNAPEGVTVQSVALYKAAAPTTAISLSANNHYTVSGTTFTMPSDMLAAWGAGSKITITFSDSHTEDITVQ